jgi:hypothetical protein
MAFILNEVLERLHLLCRLVEERHEWSHSEIMNNSNNNMYSNISAVNKAMYEHVIFLERWRRTT